NKERINKKRRELYAAAKVQSTRYSFNKNDGRPTPSTASNPLNSYSSMNFGNEIRTGDQTIHEETTNSQAAGNAPGDNRGLTHIDGEECNTYQQNGRNTLAIKAVFGRHYSNKLRFKRATNDRKYTNTNQYSPVEQQDHLIIREIENGSILDNNISINENTMLNIDDHRSKFTTAKASSNLNDLHSGMQLHTLPITLL
ncbi:hypothetical protein Leryth_021202, partial [Lithospermum erythrorhizon]